MKSLAYLLVLGGLVLMSACEPANLPGMEVDLANPPVYTLSPTVSITPEPSTPSPAAPLTENSPMPTTNTTPPPDADNMVRLSIEHLSQRLSVATDKISVTSVKAVTWRDASLGCPKPGIDYIRVETPGYNILLEAGGQAYNYHTDLTSRVVLCSTQGPFEIYMTP